jgi:parvulin-like peptidyl-prolyl isomerase
VSAIPKPKLLALIAFGAAVVLFFAGFAIAEGLGDPDVPSGDVAVVEDAPADLGNISEEDFDRALQQTAAGQSITDIPKPGSEEYEQLKTSTMNSLLDIVWIQGQAEEMGITASPEEISDLLQQTISQNFRNQAEFEEFRRQSNFTQEDIRTRIRLQILSNKIQQQILDETPEISFSEVSDYYDASQEQFVQPASRDVRLILNEDKAKVEQAQAELEQDSSDASWERVASRFSNDPSSQANGGLRSSVTEGLLEQPLDREVFSATEGQIEGPVKTPLGWYAFEVVKITPQRTIPLDRSTAEQIRGQLTQQAQQEVFSSFIDDFGSKWRARTFCASDYVIDRCANFVAGHPTTAPPACYEADPPRGRRPPDCPAPVTQLAPALPGSVSIIVPQGNRLPQRPIPAGVAAATGLPGALTPGATSTAP